VLRDQHIADLDYCIRVYRRFPQKRRYQVVVYLQETGSGLVYQTAFETETTRHEFRVIRLWEQPLDSFLESPGLLPFAVLSQVRDRAQTLRQGAERVEQLNNRQAQSNLTASVAILAGLVLDRALVKRILRKALIQESVIYQDILEEGEQAKAQRIALNLLKEGMAIEAIARVTELSVEQIQQLQTIPAQSDSK
jgi:predicted transposase/invertase (TIGR01784 family)